MMRKILGPPGTGKTTRLLHYARTFLKLGTPIDKIGYFAFTKKAAGEAKERMLDQTILQMGISKGLIKGIAEGEIKAFSDHHQSHYSSSFKMFFDNPFFGHGPKMFRYLCKFDE